MAERSTLPLLDRPLDGVFAVRDGEPVTVARFLGDVHALAERIPQRGAVINLARDRYRFQVAFAAALCRGLCTLLPPNDTVGAQLSVSEGHDSPTLLHDGAELAAGMPAYDLRQDLGTKVSTKVPQIEADTVVSRSFTSGSTGAGSEVVRRWRTHFHGVELNATTYLAGLAETSGMVATVPAQHMYGMEVTVMAPLRLPVVIASSRPLYPADVATALAQVPTPRVMVSTPLHLKAMLGSQARFPAIQRVISATAPLDAALASQLEERFGAQLIDVYGCSETGCLATRRVAVEPRWRAIPGFRFHTRNGETRVSADHLPGPVIVQDQLRMDDDGHLHFEGRSADLVNVAGKRGSLAALTALLKQAPGVEDGVIFLPRTRAGGRLAGAYSGEAAPATVHAYLAGHVDAALLPRPLLRVGALPYNDTGKLPLGALEQLLERRET
ncbi:acyl-CoA synthetase [Marinihelvus fidelis]|uniref:Acyl-CoA synthetase n=1 Tax=Marinihelvus fidelis TaxID=2613842 RepID=A0A5N0TBE8_9GAMM|nr:AMP-binding protein [Marinihelvus fidelis]KAA9131407.1 acyl-CoA synthetase [Marinihelvus fidelis]